MKKVNTQYTFSVIGSKDDFEDIKLEVNEEYPEHIRVQFYQERWRPKEEFIRLYEGIIKELKSFNS